MLTELRFAVRRLGADRWTAAAAILAVGLGAGLNVAVFTAAYGLLLRPLPYHHGDRLAVIDASGPFTQTEDWRRHLSTFERVSAYAREGLVVGGTGDPRLARVAYVDGWFFETVAARPLAGRLLTRHEVSAAVVSERFARQAALAPETLLGQHLTAGDAVVTIVGVLPETFAFPAEDVEIWIPAVNARSVSFDGVRDARRFRLIGLPRPGVPLAAVREDVERARAVLQPDEPSRAGAAPAVESLHARVTRGVRPVVLVFAGAAGLVWLVTCANLATLLIGRATARRRELAVCRALGAGRWRIAASMLSESTLLTLAGTTLGVALAAVGIGLVDSWAEGFIPRPGETRIDVISLLFASAIAAALAVVSTAWTLPAIRRAAPALRPAHGGATRSERRLRGVLLAVQVALVVVLLSGGGLLVRTIVGLLATDLGLDGRGALVSQLWLTSTTSYGGEGRWPLVRDLLERVRALPGVRAAGIGSSLPPDNAQVEISVRFTGDGGEELQRFSAASVTPGYLEAIGARLLQGRHFDQRDLEAAGPLVIISESAARAAMRDSEAAGRQLPFPLPGALRERGHPTVVGVVADIRYAGLEADPGPAVYALWKDFPMGQGYLALRTDGASRGTVAAVRTIMRDLDPTLPHPPMRTFDEIVQRTVADRRLAALLGATVALLTFGVALVGLSGGVVRAVEERRHELAIRGALGATPRRLIRLVVSDVVLFAAAGLVLGMAGALAAARVLRALIEGIGPYDALTLASVAIFVTLTSLVACYLPARRAARVDPAAVLRSE